MATNPAPTPELDERFGDATEALPWATVEQVLEQAEVFWITTVRADGQPHLTPLLAVRHEGVLHLCTGEREQKARNLGRQPRCTLFTTDSNRFADGLDVVVEGIAVRVDDETLLQALADVWVAKYGEDWRFEVVDGAFRSEQGGPALVYALEPSKVLAFTRGTYGQTRFVL